jgi:putative endonuclease
MTARRERAETFGRRGEVVAAWWLRLHGWRILAARVKTPRGEVDLVAKRGNTLAFVEVKTRKNRAELALAIDDYRVRRVAAAADLLYPKYAKAQENGRIDVILVAPWRWPQHLVNVWHG